MPKVKKAAVYAVKSGRVPGLYDTWDEVKAQVERYPGAKHQKFTSRTEAEAYLNDVPSVAEGATAVPVVSAASIPKTPYDRPAPLAESAHSIIKAVLPVPPELAAAAAAVVSAAPIPKPPSDRLAPLAESANSIIIPQSPSGHQGAKEGLKEVENGKTWNVVYTDGACSNNGQRGARGGIGVYWGPGMDNLAEPLPGAQTNNRAELIAIIRALETDPDPSAPLLLKTDSSYSISCLRDWLPNWRRNNFQTKSGPVKNKEILLYLSALMNDRPGHIKLQHVRAHVGIPGNEMADRLAVAGATKPAVPDRDWTVPDLGAAKADLHGVDFEEVPSEFFLSETELAEMGKTQAFD